MPITNGWSYAEDFLFALRPKTIRFLRPFNTTTGIVVSPSSSQKPT